MNDDTFERKLHALTGGLHRPDPTAAWKADILARARREADGISPQRTLPPRWLMLGWAAAWVAIFTMELTAPTNLTPETGHVAGAARLEPADASAQTLLAFHQRMNLHLELP